MGNRLGPAVLCAFLAACGSAPGSRERMPSQDPERVELLGDGFVRFRGERVPLEEMLYQMRRAARAADADGGLRPAIEVTDLRDLPPWDQAAQVPMQRILSDLRYYSVAVIAAEP